MATEQISRREAMGRLGAAGLGLLLSRLGLAQTAGRRPNIIFFLVDDMGWRDTTVYGSQYYDTPQMERLAARSMVFWDAHTASPLCSPTRASLMTGKHPARLGFTTAAGHLPPLPDDQSLLPESASRTAPMLLPASRRHLRPEEFTIAEALAAAGYATGHIGKWHLGLNPEHWPEAQGFQFSFHGAPDPGPRSYFSPYQFRAGTVTDGPTGEYITDRVTDEALGFISRHRDQPFFLNLWHYSVHGPWGAKEDDTQRYRDRVDPLGLQDNPIMCSMLKSVDESLGRVLDHLDALGLTENTLFIFFSDNGGNIHSDVGGKPPTNNTPLRKGKAFLYEGGTRVPLMVAWPGVVEPGSRCDATVQSTDFYPTLLRTAGLEPQPGQVLDGHDLTPLWTGAARRLDREDIFCYFPHGGPTRPPGAWLRQGDWKLIRWYLTSDEYPDQYELYDLSRDLGETTNLAAAEPARVAAMAARLDARLAACGAVVPVPNPAYSRGAQSVGGWQPFGATTLSAGAGQLTLTSTDKRTQMTTTAVPLLVGALRLQIRMRTDNPGPGMFYPATEQQPGFSPNQRIDFRTAGTDWLELDLEFAATSPLRGLRLDLRSVPTTVVVDWIRLVGPDGQVAREWTFD